MGFYSRLCEAQGYDAPPRACFESVVGQLEAAAEPEKPGMLLGKIQSGKRRAFLGGNGHGFDRDFDVAVVLNKGTKTLAKQTVKQLVATSESLFRTI